jgi:CheY-like chemotaxis protein
MNLAATDPHDYRSMVLLVADAEEEPPSAYRESLSLAGCEVVDAAGDRKCARQSTSASTPTGVIIETRLPQFDGQVLCEVRRGHSATRTVLIVVMTTEARPAELERARAAGADAVLLQPVCRETLLDPIQRLLTHLHSEPPTHRVHPRALSIVQPLPQLRAQPHQRPPSGTGGSHIVSAYCVVLTTRRRRADSERSRSSWKRRTDQPALRSRGQVNNEPIGGARFCRFSATAGHFTDVADTNSRCNEPTRNGRVSRKGQGS